MNFMRRVELKQKDHAYDVQKALDGYFELEPQVLGFVDVTGQPMMKSPAAPVFAKQVLLAAPVAPGARTAFANCVTATSSAGRAKRDLTRDGVLRAFHETSLIDTLS